MENKRGLTTLMLLVMVATGLVLLVFLGITAWGFSLFDQSMSSLENIQIGNQSFQETYNNTLKLGVEEMKTNVPTTLSVGIMLGYVLVMIIIGYNSKKIGLLWILADLAIMIIATIAANEVSTRFVTYMNSIPELLTVYSTTLSESASFVINLPKYIPIIGALIMLATYINYNKNKETQGEYF